MRYMPLIFSLFPRKNTKSPKFLIAQADGVGVAVFVVVGWGKAVGVKVSVGTLWVDVATGEDVTTTVCIGLVETITSCGGSVGISKEQLLNNKINKKEQIQNLDRDRDLCILFLLYVCLLYRKVSYWAVGGISPPFTSIAVRPLKARVHG
jgi:hypothetical protein